MSALDDLLIILSSYHDGYRLMRRRMRGSSGYTSQERERYGIGARRISLNADQVMLSRLKQKGFAENKERGIWTLTARGATLARRVIAKREQIVHARTTQPNLIIAFDIPEKDAQKRQWLRSKLQFAGFKMLQKSVWFGPGPLSADLVEELRIRRLLPHMKFFSAREADIV